MLACARCRQTFAIEFQAAPQDATDGIGVIDDRLDTRETSKQSGMHVANDNIKTTQMNGLVVRGGGTYPPPSRSF
jgi:hypothetical protein